ncbi:MAG: hypothetical protein JO119_14120 [Acidobacteria bacterium]|nr:hypothetical protein [Acidobacteriota bacterium]
MDSPHPPNVPADHLTDGAAYGENGWFRNSAIARRFRTFAKTPFGALLRIFLGRMFHGGTDDEQGQLDMGVGIVTVLLAMPGLLVSLLMFEKYGSLIHFLRGERNFDTFAATIPDEYFFITLSVVVTGIATLWRWDAIFLDRRDYANLVPLPISLKVIFSANFLAILIFAGFLMVVVNAASLLFYPIAVMGSQPYLDVWFRFMAGHGIAVFLASAFSFFAVFAIAGFLMSVLPATAFRRISLLVRFAVGLVLLVLLATTFVVPEQFGHLSTSNGRLLSLTPPVSFIGIARTVWIHKVEPGVQAMTQAALVALFTAMVVALITYAISFRRQFVRIPEMADDPPVARLRLSLSFLAPLEKLLKWSPSQCACVRFVIATVSRSEAHLQIVLAFAALGLVAATESLNTPRGISFLLSQRFPPLEFLAVPFVLNYCVLAGIRFAFEIPADLRANWIFRMWIDSDSHPARPIARRAMHVLTLSWLAPLTFAATLYFFGLQAATLHTAIFIGSSALLVEVLIANFRKIPFTCPYPQFESNSGLVLVAYLFGFFIFTDYLPQIEKWALVEPFRILLLVPLFAAGFAGIHAYRSQLLDMDKSLVFDA